MSELVPDSWRLMDDDAGTKCCHLPRRVSRRMPVTDIMLWLECYSTLVTVLSTQYPDKSVEFWVYQSTILRAHRDFEGEALVTYDTCYCQQAANTKSLNWSQIDFTLYNQTFAGKARMKLRCALCLSEHHITDNCDFATDNMATRGIQSSRPTRRVQGKGRTTKTPTQHDTIEVCTLFNADRGNICR